MVQPYPEGGHVVEFWLDHEEPTRAEYIFNLIDQGERLGGNWWVSSVHSDATAGCGRCSISGITSILWSADTEPLVKARAGRLNRDEESVAHSFSQA